MYRSEETGQKVMPNKGEAGDKAIFIIVAMEGVLRWRIWASYPNLAKSLVQKKGKLFKCES